MLPNCRTRLIIIDLSNTCNAPMFVYVQQVSIVGTWRQLSS